MGNFFWGYILGRGAGNDPDGKGMMGLSILIAILFSSFYLIPLLLIPSEIFIHLHYLKNHRNIEIQYTNPIPLTVAITPIILWPIYITSYLGTRKKAVISFLILAAITIYICFTHDASWSGPINDLKKIFPYNKIGVSEERSSTIHAALSITATLSLIIAVRLLTRRMGDEGRALWLNRLCRPYIYAWNFLSQRLIVSLIAALLFGFMAIGSAYRNIDYRNFVISNIEQGAQKHGWSAEHVETLIAERGAPIEWIYIAFLAILTNVFIWNVVRLLKIRKLRREGPA